MTDSNRVFDQQYTDPAQQYANQEHKAIDAIAEAASDHPVTTGVSVISGGLAGAVIGQFVGGRLGAAIGAVVGGVAGAAFSQEAGDGIDRAVESATEKVKGKVEEIKPSVVSAVETVKEKVQGNKPEDLNAGDRSSQNLVPPIPEGVTAINTITMPDPQPSVVPPQEPTFTTTRQVAPSIDGTVSDRTVMQTPRTVIQAPESSVDERYEQGLEMGKQGNLVGAIAAFQAVIEQEPDYAEAHYNLGVVLGRHGLREQGIEHIKISRALCQTQGRSREADNIDQILQKLGAV